MDIVGGKRLAGCTYHVSTLPRDNGMERAVRNERSNTTSMSQSPRLKATSQFTYKQLAQLKAFSTQTPLRVIAHVDLDAFYAQCEAVRLGVDPSKPLAVQQWQGLIAINYPARAYGLSRHVTAAEALKQCPELMMQHVATWKEGDETWAYHPDAFANMATHKVSLDPYRKESRRILQCIRDALPSRDQRIEKASVDEVFMDLGAHVHAILLERYPELRATAPYDDPSQSLPMVPTTVLDWAADALVETGTDDGEDRDPDWDDVCMLIASELVRHVRRHIYVSLGYTCSAGIACNKMLAKLGSTHRKPNQQTVIRNRSVTHFLSDMKFTKIRMLGGKLGDDIVAMFGTDKVKDILQQPLDQLKRLGDDTGTWLYAITRGQDHTEVNPRTQIKSMLSAKSFRPSINSFEQGVRWLRIFAADIFSRCLEEGVLENKRRPKTINLHHRQGSQTRSRSSPIPQGKPLSEIILFDLAKKLLAQVVVDGRAWPCANLSLSVGGFEDGVKNNAGIGGFLVRGDEAKVIMSTERPEPPAKKRRTNKGNIASFFGPKDAKTLEFDAARAVLKAHRESIGEDVDDAEYVEQVRNQDIEDSADNTHDLQAARHSTPLPEYQNSGEPHRSKTPPSAQPPPSSHLSPSHHSKTTPPGSIVLRAHTWQQAADEHFCPRCNIHLPIAEQTEHLDYHFALDLSKEMRQETRDTQLPAQTIRRVPTGSKPTRGRGRPPGANTGRGVEKGQAKLAFGRRT
jgi:DNA polymerase eta